MEYSLEMLLESHPDEPASVMLQVHRWLKDAPNWVFKTVIEAGNRFITIEELTEGLQECFYSGYERLVKGELIDVVIEAYNSNSPVDGFNTLIKYRATFAKNKGGWELEERSDTSHTYEQDYYYPTIKIHENLHERIDQLTDAYNAKMGTEVTASHLCTEMLDDVVDIWLEEYQQDNGNKGANHGYV